MANFDPAFVKTLALEGGYSNDADDSGGETRYGITIAVARGAGYLGMMADLPLALAKEIYKRRYWDRILGDEIPDQEIAEKMFDSGVNMGIHRPIEWLQRILNAHNGKGTRYPDIPADGVMGSGTLAALRTALAVAPYYKTNILKCLNGLQATRYLEISERNTTLESFVPGWIRNRVGLPG